MSSFLSDKEWRNLLLAIRNRRVIPILGPELVTTTDNGNELSLYEFLAPKLANELTLNDAGKYSSINQVACDALLQGTARQDIYDEIRSLMDQHRNLPANESLLKLAGIENFNFFISGTFDDQLVHALKERRPNFDPVANTIEFHPTRAQDIPDLGRMPPTTVCHILGHYNTYPDFAVWEEDYMEFICGLLERSNELTNLFTLLKDQYLLMLGAPANDWIVRFFLRIARQQRLSDSRAGGEYLADESTNLEKPMVFFFDRMIQTTRVIDGPPAAFVDELTERWESQNDGANDNEELLKRIPEQLPKDSVFISYAREDIDYALQIAKTLSSLGIPVWLDKGRLRNGEDFESSLEFAITRLSSFFISVISNVTEDPASCERFVHKEREWAAERHRDGYVFYLPIVVSEEIKLVKQEQDRFQKIHFDYLVDGKLPNVFTARLQELHKAYTTSGPPMVGQFG